MKLKEVAKKYSLDEYDLEDFLIKQNLDYKDGVGGPSIEDAKVPEYVARFIAEKNGEKLSGDPEAYLASGKIKAYTGPVSEVPQNTYVFRSYASATFLKIGAVLTCMMIIAIALILVVLIKANTLLTIVIILAALLLGISLTASTMVLANMSDDQKYMAEMLGELVKNREAGQ